MRSLLLLLCALVHLLLLWLLLLRAIEFLHPEAIRVHLLENFFLELPNLCVSVLADFSVKSSCSSEKVCCDCRWNLGGSIDS
jgi:hypothetical protein